jgi:cyanuric acid amidohydrolase
MRHPVVDVLRIPTTGPGDTAGLMALVESGRIDPRDILAVLGKTEGNGCVNDFTREYAVHALCAALAGPLAMTPQAVEQRIAFVMSGGTEGVLSPHLSVFTRRFAEGPAPDGGRRLSVGIAQTRDFLPEEIGREAQIAETAAAVAAAMQDAGISDIADVHFVQVKCPLLTSDRIGAAQARGHDTVTDDTYGSMGFSRGASALGVARALHEVTDVGAADVLADWTRYSGVASASAGIELMHNVVVVMGNSTAAGGDLVIGHAVMRDAIDAAAVTAALGSVGIRPGDGSEARLVNVFAKAEASPDGRVRGLRHTMLNDSDINSTRHARAAVGGLIAGLAGSTAVYVSGGAEHQGPPGGGPIAVVARA